MCKEAANQFELAGISTRAVMPSCHGDNRCRDFIHPR